MVRTPHAHLGPLACHAHLQPAPGWVPPPATLGAILGSLCTRGAQMWALGPI